MLSESENVVWSPREEVPWNNIHYMDLSLHDHSNLEDNIYLEQLKLFHWSLRLTGLTGLVDSLASETGMTSLLNIELLLHISRMGRATKSNFNI